MSQIRERCSVPYSDNIFCIIVCIEMYMGLIFKLSCGVYFILVVIL
jgi:hypothetical protein